MGDWQELMQSIFISLFFSYLVAKLISIVISFRDENLRIVREEDLRVESTGPDTKSSDDVEHKSDSEPIVKNLGTYSVEKSSDGEEEIGVDEKQKELSESFLGDDEDDWEGVESTELDEEFSAATAFVAAAASDRLSQKVSNDAQLQLYGFYKIATEGPCNTPQPSALKMSARAKWNAWQKLGAMPPEEAMQEYIMIVTELYPSWATGSTTKKNKDGDNDSTNLAGKGPMGPVFSTFVYEEESDNESKMDAIHASAREGEIDNVLKCIEASVSVNLKDSEGRTPLHWAVDRGHINIVELLLGKNADVNAQDNEGQTPLHYATMCDREGIAKLLVNQNGSTDLKDNDGNSPCDLCDSNWSWMHPPLAGKLVE